MLSDDDTQRIARQEAIARRLIIAQLEAVRDHESSVTIETFAMADLLPLDIDEDWWKQDWVGVLMWAAQIAASALIASGDIKIDDDTTVVEIEQAANIAIESMQPRLAYLIDLKEELA